MSDEKRTPSVPEEDPDRTEMQRQEPFGDLTLGGDETLAQDPDATLAQDVNATMAFDEDATMAAPDHEAPGDLPANLPTTIGKYQVLGKLGEGGMGVVLEAEQQNPKRRVALKVIRGGQFVDDDQIRMFKREADTLALLKHANIGAIYESGHTDGGRHFFAMELVRGKTLDDYLADRPQTLDRDELQHRLELFRKIADAVHYAHQRGVIHRDLKPSNIVVPDLEDDEESVSGSGIPEIKILDFGLARITEGDMAAVTVQSEVGLIKGTLPYMSPEQARGMPEEIDLRTDVYALGVILYEMLVGQRPYDTQQASLIEAVRVIHEEPPKPLRQSWSGRGKVDEDLETIAGKSLEKDADDRYGSAAALSEDIGRYLTSQPILARPPSTIYQLKKLVARNRLGTAFAATVLLLLIGFGVWMSYLYRQSEEARRQSELARTRAEASKLLALGRVEFQTSPSSALAYARTSLEVADDPAARRFALEALWQGPTARVARPAPSVGSEFSPNGEYLAMGTHDFATGDSGVALLSSTGGTAELLGLQSNHRDSTGFDAHSSRVYARRFQDDVIENWSLPGGDSLDPTEFGTVHSFFQSLDRQFLFTLTYTEDDFTEVRQWSSETHELVSEGRISIDRTQDFHTLVDVDPSVSWLAYIQGGQVFVDAVDSLGTQPPRRVGAHERAWAVLFHPSEPILVSAAYETGEFHFWSLDEVSEKPVRTLVYEPFTSPPKFDATGRYLATGGGQGSWIWDLEAPPDAGPVLLERPAQDSIHTVTFHPQAPWLMTNDSNAGTLWPLAKPWPLDLLGHRNPVDALVFDPEGRWLMSSALGFCSGRRWPLEGTKKGTELPGFCGRSVALDAAGDRLAVVVDQESAQLYSLETGETQILGRGDFWEVTISGDGRYVAATGGQFESEDALVRIWDLETGEEFVLDAGDGQFVQDALFLGEDRVVASGFSGLRIWNLESREFETVSEDVSGEVVASPDGRVLLALTGPNTEMRLGGTVVVYELDSGESRELTAHGDGVNALDLDATGTQVATGDITGAVRMGSIEGGEPHYFLGLSGRIDSVAIDPKGRWIASGDSDGLVRLWPIPEGEPFHALPLEEILSRLESLTNYRVVADEQSPDGYRLEIGTFEGWQDAPVW